MIFDDRATAPSSLSPSHPSYLLLHWSFLQHLRFAYYCRLEDGLLSAEAEPSLDYSD